jgi:hypothetical protein
MELVRAYVELAFREQKKIKPEDVDRLVDRYLSGYTLAQIAQEEAWRKQRIQNSVIRSQYTRSSPTPNSWYQIDDQEEEKKEEESPEKPETSPLRFEGQKGNESIKEHNLRKSVSMWRFGVGLAGLAVLIVNLTVVALRFQDISFSFPIGFIPVPFLILMLHMQKKRTESLRRESMKRMEEEQRRRLEQDSQGVRNRILSGVISRQEMRDRIGMHRTGEARRRPSSDTTIRR